MDSRAVPGTDVAFMDECNAAAIGMIVMDIYKGYGVGAEEGK